MTTYISYIRTSETYQEVSSITWGEQLPAYNQLDIMIQAERKIVLIVIIKNV